MITETQVTLTQSELTTILILCTEFLRRESQGIRTDMYRTNRTREIWLNNCNALVMKADNAMNQCLLANEQTPRINY